TMSSGSSRFSSPRVRTIDPEPAEEGKRITNVERLSNACPCEEVRSSRRRAQRGSHPLQLQPEAAAAGAAVDSDLSSLGLHQVLGDGEAQAAAAALAPAPGIGAVEALEDARLMSSLDARAVVLDRKHHAIALRLGGARDRAAGRSAL